MLVALLVPLGLAILFFAFMLTRAAIAEQAVHAASVGRLDGADRMVELIDAARRASHSSDG